MLSSSSSTSPPDRSINRCNKWHNKRSIREQVSSTFSSNEAKSYSIKSHSLSYFRFICETIRSKRKDFFRQSEERVIRRATCPQRLEKLLYGSHYMDRVQHFQLIDRWNDGFLLGKGWWCIRDTEVRSLKECEWLDRSESDEPYQRSDNWVTRWYDWMIHNAIDEFGVAFLIESA